MNGASGRVRPIRPADATPPQAPKPKRACERCDYFNRTDKARGECRARPPVVVTPADNAPETVFPKVENAMWCRGFTEAES